MANDDDTGQSPFTRPGFIIAALVVAVIVVLGTILATVGIVNANRETTGPPPPAPTSTTEPTSSSDTPATEASVCGLPGEVLTGTVSEPPAAQWEFQGTTAYPVSPEYGPGKTTDEGVRTCFQHSPEGALFAAANGAAQATEPETARAWGEYFIAEGPGGEALLDTEQTSAPATAGTRVRLVGFRMLEYTGETAQVDLAFRSSTEGETVHFSMVYTLVWEEGDWKLRVDDPTKPLDFAALPDTAGYVLWGA